MPNLLLIPTQLEMTLLRPRLAQAARDGDWSLELCGFGPIAAAARTSLLVARQQPRRVLLLGIAGTYCRHAAIGTAMAFDRVACYGVGAGAGEDFQTAGDLGWHHWRETDSSQTIGDVISLENAAADEVPSGDLLLTCCSAAASVAEVKCRTGRFPEATAEDMEGYGVALACELAGVPLQIARGISNHAGNRNKDHWQSTVALEAVAELALTIIARE